LSHNKSLFIKDSAGLALTRGIKFFRQQC